MIDGKKVLAIIPARGGSKRLPGKNIMNLAGKPLISWTIEAAKKSTYIDKVVVSTDCPEINCIAIKYKASMPFLRPEYLSGDKTTTVDVVKYVLEEESEEFDIVILLQPTSPLRTYVHIDEACAFYSSKDASGVISVCLAEHSPIWTNTIGEDMDMSNFIPEKYKNIRSQELPSYYRLNGAIYISSKNDLIAESSFMLSSNLYAYEMDSTSSVDIDEEKDFLIADYIMKKNTGAL